MNFIKKLSNLLFGTSYHLNIARFHNPSKDKLALSYFLQAEQRSITSSGEHWHD